MPDNNDDHFSKNDNVVSFRKKPALQQKPPHPPLINLPPVTKYLCLVLIAIHIVLWCGSEIFHLLDSGFIFYHLGFVSERLTDLAAFNIWGIVSLFTFTFLHGGWLHLLINIASLAAFGAGVERFFGMKRMLVIFFASSLLAAFAHLIASPGSQNPIVGASGGISGLFGAVLILLQAQGQLAQTNNRIFPIAAIFVVISVLFGYMGAPDGSPIAWIAHIGGFLGGLLIAKQLVKKL